MTVTGTYLQSSGQPASGTIVFQLSYEMTDGVGTTVPSVPIPVKLDGTGSFTIVLFANDDTTTTPAGTTWQVQEFLDLPNVVSRGYNVGLQKAHTTVNIAGLAPAIPQIPLFNYITQTAADARYAAIGSGGGGGISITPDGDTATSGALAAGVQAYVDCSGAPRTRTLPTGQTAGTVFLAEKADSSANTLTLTGNIRGVPSSSLVIKTQHQLVALLVDSAGSFWPIWGHLDIGSLDLRYPPAFVDVEISDTLSFPGIIQTGLLPSRWYVERPCTFESLRASVNTAASGSAIIVDLLRNGTTSIYHATPANRPTIAAAGFTELGGAPDDTTYSIGDYFQVNVIQVGSSIAGADLTLQPRFKATA